MGTDLLAAVIVSVVSFAMGAALSASKRKRPSSPPAIAPQVWPLRPRSIVNSQELQVWRWLRTTFPEHVIAVKMPVPRFTMALPGHDSKAMYRLLGGLYCTFAICRGDGHVVACVDLPGPAGIKQSARSVKAALLGQCGIRYATFTPTALPPQDEARELLLGRATATLDEAGRPAVSDAHRRLRTSITERRSRRPSLSPSSESGSTPVEWQQADSFIAPLDSRMSELA